MHLVTIKHKAIFVYISTLHCIALYCMNRYLIAIELGELIQLDCNSFN